MFPITLSTQHVSVFFMGAKWPLPSTRPKASINKQTRFRFYSSTAPPLCASANDVITNDVIVCPSPSGCPSWLPPPPYRAGSVDSPDGPRRLLGKISRKLKGLTTRPEKRASGEDVGRPAKRPRPAAPAAAAAKSGGSGEGRRVGNSVFFDSAERRWDGWVEEVWASAGDLAVLCESRKVKIVVSAMFVTGWSAGRNVGRGGLAVSEWSGLSPAELRGRGVTSGGGA